MKRTPLDRPSRANQRPHFFEHRRAAHPIDEALNVRTLTGRPLRNAAAAG